MKQIYFLLHFIIFFNTATFSQKNNVNIYAFDENWKSCTIENAKYLSFQERVSDTVWEWKNYNFSGPLISIETYKDEKAAIPHGYFAWFDSNGLIDSAGFTYEGKKDKTWYYYTDTLSVWQIMEYDKGKLISSKDLAMLTEERRKNDSIGLKPGDKEAVIKGGDKAWIKYLQNNLKVPERAEKLGIGGTTRVYFMVDSDGTTKNIRIYKSVEYSLDEEAVRLIRESPKWEPALQSGKPVKAYRIQPVTYVF